MSSRIFSSALFDASLMTPRSRSDRGGFFLCLDRGWEACGALLGPDARSASKGDQTRPSPSDANGREHQRGSRPLAIPVSAGIAQACGWKPGIGVSADAHSARSCAISVRDLRTPACKVAGYALGSLRRSQSATHSLSRQERAPRPVLRERSRPGSNLCSPQPRRTGSLRPGDPLPGTVGPGQVRDRRALPQYRPPACAARSASGGTAAAAGAAPCPPEDGAT